MALAKSAHMDLLLGDHCLMQVWLDGEWRSIHQPPAVDPDEATPIYDRLVAGDPESTPIYESVERVQLATQHWALTFCDVIE